MALESQLQGTRYQRVLWGPVEKGAALQDTGHGKECGGGHLQAKLRADRQSAKAPSGLDPQESWVHTHLDSTQQVFSCVITTWNHLAETLRIGGP